MSYLISTDRALLDVGMIHHFLSRESYWARHIPRELVERSIEHSLCFGAYDEEGRQVGFARVVTDYAVFAYLADVFVLPPHRGRGVAKQLMETIRHHPALQGLRRWCLVTRDAHALYRQYGFTAPVKPEGYMEIAVPNAYAPPDVAEPESLAG